MTVRRQLMKILLQEDLNFLLTNRLPRRLATQLMGHVSKIRHPAIRLPSLALWRFFSGADLSDANDQRFESLHHAFTRTLKPGSRPADPDPLTIASPCDAIIGAHGLVEDGQLHQIKGFPYRLSDLLPDPELVERFRNGRYVTLRLTAGMYHRFHAPHDIQIDGITYLSGDCWNVNPIALKRVENLFCRNERAVIEARLTQCDTPLLIVPVAAILVASIRLSFLDVQDNLRERGPARIPCNKSFRKGAELGWFEHGSTIILFAPDDFTMTPGCSEGLSILAGHALLQRRGP